MTSQVLAWTAALSLGGPVALAQSAGSLATPGSFVSPGGSGAAGGGAPLAAVSGVDEKECEAITAQRGESAVIAEKTKELGQAFLFLKDDEFMLEEFQVEDREECATLFGLFPGGATQAAAAGAAAGAGFGTTLGAVGIGTVVGVGVGITVVGGVLATTVLSGPNDTIPAVNSE